MQQSELFPCDNYKGGKNLIAAIEAAKLMRETAKKFPQHFFLSSLIGI